MFQHAQQNFCGSNIIDACTMFVEKWKMQSQRLYSTPVIVILSSDIMLTQSSITAPSIALWAERNLRVDATSIVDTTARGADLVTASGQEGSGGGALS